MKIRALSRDEHAVSPVIGVILTVAITVLLVATAGAILMEMGKTPAERQSPTAGFDFNYGTEGNDQKLSVSHAGGDSVDRENLRIVVVDANAAGSGVKDPNGRYRLGTLGVSDKLVTAGTTAHVTDDNLRMNSGDRLDLSSAEIRVVWVSDSGEQSQILTRWKGPSA
jgi:flagellin-like protein